MEIMRATYHCGRGKNASTKHNDRNFDLNKAPHINQDMTNKNITAHIFSKQHPEWSFEQAELEYYKMRYGKALEAQNERYKEQSKEKYIRTIEDIYKGKKTRPDEVLLQIGNKDEHPDEKTLINCYNDFNRKFRIWNNEHGNHVHILSVALHLDESTPHLQIKRVFDYKDNNSDIRIGQNKGLEQAGIHLPNPNQSPGRNNNRKMVFDAMLRNMWLETLREHGLQIEIEPLLSRKHLDKEDYIDHQINLKNEELKALEKVVESLRDSKENLEKSVNQLKSNQLAYEKKKAKWDDRFKGIPDLAPIRHKAISKHER